MGPTRPFTPPDKETKTTETTSRTGLGCTAMERLISRAWAIPIGKGLERNRPERTCAYNGLPHSGRSFFGGTHRTHPGNRSCCRTPRFRGPPLVRKRLSDRGHNPQPPRYRPHMDTGRGRTNRSPATLPAAVGNFVRKPCAVKGLNKMDASPARFPELEQCAYRIAITCMDDDKKEQDTSSRHILPDFTGFWRVVLEAEYRFGGSRTSNLTQDQWPAKTRHLHPEGDVVHIIVPSTEYRTWREGGETRRKQRIAITWPAYATIAA